ncbi:PH domain-containing protein [Dactylosporangium sp. NBC_01737]|uniref:PH domain-containing protein n=1 Tax=Dactylosporangium sp. NBC_01737 TaxID=2975959 RepID=UPI002E1100AC|nr:PH domain-containing protein [Dactylosporangium sp. NBC_01737]
MSPAPSLQARPETDVPQPDDDVPWRRLDIRVVYVDLVMLVLSLIPTAVTMGVFHLGFDTFSIWTAIVTTALGVVGAVGDLIRWWRTWYRITPERVEQRTGVWFTSFRFVPRDRIRSVDMHARLRHRVAGLRIVLIGSGEATPSFKLDALSVAMARQLRHDLMGAVAAPPAAETEVEVTEDGDTVIARLRWRWIFYNLVNAWAFLVAAFLLWSTFWLLQLVGVNLADILRRVVDWDGLGLGWSIVVAVAGTWLLGVCGLAIGFVTDNWGFVLLRTQTEHGSALLTRQGLLQTREIYRDDARLRGIHFSEPLFWRWCGLAETEVISTGLAGWVSGKEPASAILPRGPVSEARRVAALVLDDGYLPMEAPLRRHARGALVRRVFWALFVPAFLAGMLAWMDALGGVPSWTWIAALCLTPVTLQFARVAYRTLGHGIVGPYIVLRCGLATRSTAALQTRSVIGWTMRETIVQRMLGLLTVRVSTAAGFKFYQAPDIGMDQAVAFVNDADPALIGDFLEPGPGRSTG